MGFLRKLNNWTLQQKVGASFIVVLIFLLMVVLLAFRNMTDYMSAVNAVEQTYEVISALENYSGNLNRTVAEQRNYILTADSDYLARYRASVTQLEANQRQLKGLLQDNPYQVQSLDAIQPLIQRRLGLLEQSVHLRDSGQNGMALAIIRSSESKELTRRINLGLEQMQANERALLDTRRDEAGLRAADMLVSFTAGIIFTMLTLGGVYTLVNREMSERLRVESSLRDSERRYALAALGTNDGLWDWNLETGEIYFSPRWKMILGYQDKEIGNSPDEWFNLVHPDDIEGLKRQIDEHLEGYAASLEYEYRMLHKDGDVRWVLTRGVSAYDDFGKPNRIAGSLSDITDRKLDEERLLYEATHDALTGLYNRQYFMQQLEVEINSAKRYHYPLSLCMGDLDKFKEINDIHGHLTGDNVLISFASLLKQQIRMNDMAGRFGGDEFCFYFPHTRAEDMYIVLERIRTEFEKLVFVAENGEQFSLTCTFGVAELQPTHKEGKNLIEMADKALYQAKQQRNKVVIHPACLTPETDSNSATASN